MAEGRVFSEEKESIESWEIKDKFCYAPPKPEGDPWSVLLKPLLEKDKIQCDVWKEEVQNLLIFAGLFSAVVTAFVVESYKTLQPDPNATIISLLSHIASRLDNPLNGTDGDSMASAALASSSPTPSSTRVNIFWFLSLILSLTTVLVGIVTLQWLREYQSYPGLTPKQIRAVFRMRSEGMERWHVWKILTALPLLIQAALVLFFGGVIEFLFALENKVAIPVAVVIGITLLFLVATTVLPALQGLLLYIPFVFSRDLSKEPSQCPYKSPQSHAFRTAFCFSFTVFHHILPLFRRVIQRIRSVFCPICRYLSSVFRPQQQHEPEKARDFTRQDEDVESNGRATIVTPKDADKGLEIEDHHVIPQLLLTWRTSTWIEFDSAWLRLRDACVNGLVDRRPGLKDHRHQHNPSGLPLFDSVRAIQEGVVHSNANYGDSSIFLSAIYSAFSELSALQFKVSSVHDLGEDIYHRNRRNQYFFALWNGTTDYETEYLVTAPSSASRYREFLEALHHQNLLLFISLNWGNVIMPQILASHTTELHIQLARRLSSHQSIQPAWNSEFPRHLIMPHDLELSMDHVLYCHYSSAILQFFQHAATIKNQDILPGFLHTHPCVVDFLRSASKATSAATKREYIGEHGEEWVDEANEEAYQKIFQCIERGLGPQAFSSGRSWGYRKIGLDNLYLLYTSAIYVKFMKCDANVTFLVDQGVEQLLAPMHKCKKQSIDAGVVNIFLEAQFKGIDPQQDAWSWNYQHTPPVNVIRFTKEWWAFLDRQSLPEKSGNTGCKPYTLM